MRENKYILLKKKTKIFNKCQSYLICFIQKQQKTDLDCQKFDENEAAYINFNIN